MTCSASRPPGVPACRKAGVNGNDFGVSVSASDNALISDPDQWFQQFG